MKPSAGHWILDPSRSSVSFTVRNYVVLTVRGRFQLLAGSADLTDDVSDSRLEVIIDTTSFDTGNGKRDHHVKSGDFLAADRHPQGTFTSTRVIETDDGFRVDGDLLLGPGRAPVVFDVVAEETEPGRATFRGCATLERKTLGITRLADFIVGDRVAVAVEGVATRA